MLDIIPLRAVQIVMSVKQEHFPKQMVQVRVLIAHLDTIVHRLHKLFAMPDITLKPKVLIASYVYTGLILKTKVKLQKVVITQ